VSFVSVVSIYTEIASGSVDNSTPFVDGGADRIAMTEVSAITKLR